jgi:hypothetical protein
MSPLMRRRPLLRAVAISGGAYRIGKRRGGAKRRESQEKQRLEQLDDLHEADSLTAEDFARLRATLLDS